MRTRLGIAIAIAAVLVVCFVAVQVIAAEKAETGKETTITLKQLPRAVKATLLKNSKGAKIQEIEKTVTKGVTTYSADIAKGGKIFDVEIAANGKLIKIEEDKPAAKAEAKDKEGDESAEGAEPANEVDVAFADVPAAVQNTIKDWAGAGKIDGVEKGVTNGKTIYSADVTKDGKVWDVMVAEDGTLIKSEIDAPAKAGKAAPASKESDEKGEAGEAGEKGE